MALGLLLFLINFLPWYRVDLGQFGAVSRNGWQSPGEVWSILTALLGCFLGLTAAVKMMDPPWWRVALALVIAGLLLGKYSEESSYLSIGFYGSCAITVAMFFTALSIARKPA